MDLVKELGDYLRGIASEAIIRSGDYPRERVAIDVVVILSQLKDVEKVRQFYARSVSVIEGMKRKQQQATTPRLSVTEEAAKDIPTLL